MIKRSYFLGLLSSRGILFLMTFYFIVLLIPLFVPHDDVWKPAVTTYYKIETPGFFENLGGYIHFLTSPLILILFACFHDIAPRPQKVFSSIALSLIISSTVLRTLAFTGQIEISHFNINACGNECLSYQTYLLLSGFISSVHLMSVTIFIGLAELLLIPIFSKKTGPEKNLRIVFFISGILNLLSALPLKTYSGERSGVIFLISQLFLIIVMAFCIKFFRQVRTNNSKE